MTIPPDPTPGRATDARGKPVTLGEYAGFEIYPMPMFATLAVADVAATAQWYQLALGFGVVFSMPPVGGQPSLVHLRRQKYQDVLLRAAGAAGAGVAPSSLTLSFQTDDVDALAARARSVEAVGLAAVEGPIDTPWNTRDLRVRDPFGHRLVFTGRPANPDPTRAAHWKAMFDAAR